MVKLRGEGTYVSFVFVYFNIQPTFIEGKVKRENYASARYLRKAFRANCWQKLGIF